MHGQEKDGSWRFHTRVESTGVFKGMDYSDLGTDNAAEAVKAAVEAKKIAIHTAEIQMVPQNTIEVADKSPALVKLLEMVEENDDVQKVWSNGDLDEKYLTEE